MSAHLWPTRNQWRTWSLPSRLTALGALVGVLSLALAVGVWRSGSNETTRILAELGAIRATLVQRVARRSSADLLQLRTLVEGATQLLEAKHGMRVNASLAENVPGEYIETLVKGMFGTTIRVQSARKVTLTQSTIRSYSSVTTVSFLALHAPSTLPVQVELRESFDSDHSFTVTPDLSRLSVSDVRLEFNLAGVFVNDTTMESWVFRL